MTQVHVYGAAGYAAAELIRLLQRHPDAKLGVLASQSHAGERIGDHFPHLRTLARRFDAPADVAEAVALGDCVFLAANQGLAIHLAPRYLAKGAKVIDLSADFRMYGAAHDAVYGFPERYSEAIAKAALVANPGCYPTATLLALTPLAQLRERLVGCVVDAKSGITGAGRTPGVTSLFAEVDGDVRAYGLLGHRHEPEILQELEAAGIAAPLVFTPHVVPIRRGMLVDAYATLASAPSPQAVRAAFVRAYGGTPFVRLLDEGIAPSIPALIGTNDAEIHVSVHANIVRVLCAIDNLGKGAAGQAVQNFNIMHGYPQERGIHDRAIAG